MTRDQRIDAACAAVFKSEKAKDAFRKTAALFPDYSIFWNPDAEDAKAMLEQCAGPEPLVIEFYDLS